MGTISKLVVVAFVAVSGLVVGCAGATGAPIHIVHQHETGGEIALIGPNVAAHHAAEDAMLAHCEGRVRMVTIPASQTQQGPRGDRVQYECVSRARLLAGR